MRARAWLFLALLPGCGGGETAASTSATSTPSTTTATSGSGGAGGASTTASSGGGGAGSTSTAATGGSGGATVSGSGAASGGATVSGSGGGSGGATTSTSTGMGGGMPGPCTWGDDCGAGHYCLAPGCAAGTCTKKPVAGLSPDEDPVCGCDGVTYWNEDVAASKGASVEFAGPCAMPVFCGPDMPCPGTMKCNRQVADMASCSPDAAGECWGTAISCPLDGPKARACSNNACELKCSLIQSQNPWFEDASCD